MLLVFSVLFVSVFNNIFSFISQVCFLVNENLNVERSPYPTKTKFCFKLLWSSCSCFCCSVPSGGVEYCDELVCLSLCSQVYLKNHASRSKPIFFACCLWPLLGASQFWMTLSLHGISCSFGLLTFVLTLAITVIFFWKFIDYRSC